MSDLRDSLVQSGTLIGYLNTIVYAHNYNDLSNKPQINGVTLQGNKTASDLGLVTPATEAVQSVNGETGAVVLDGNDIAYDANYTVNAKIADVESQITASGVSSVNGQTGAVTIDGDDIEYSAGVTVNDKIDTVEASIPVVAYPVTSVNTKTGDVVLDGDDIEYSEGVTVNDQIDTVDGKTTTNATAIGSLSTLTTTDKSSLVGAVNEIARYTPVYGNTASGAIATFDTSLALPLQNCEIAINAVQEAGTPTPSSPKAITGFTGANIHVADNETPHIIDNVIAITWQDEAGTVYGGALDVTSGKLTVTHDFLDLGSNSWSYNSGGQGRWVCTAINTIVKKPSTQAIVANIICSHYQSKTAQNIFGGQLGIAINTDGNIWIHDPTYDGYTSTDFKTAMSGVMLVYELATPQTYQLTPTQISAIVGTNNVFTDTNGNTSVMYACSLKDYIDSQ